jgi:hypothetical protein
MCEFSSEKRQKEFHVFEILSHLVMKELHL